MTQLIWEQSTDDMVTAKFGNDGHWLAITTDGDGFELDLLDEYGDSVGTPEKFDDLDAAKAAAQAHGESALEADAEEYRCRHCGKIVSADDCLVCGDCE